MKSTFGQITAADIKKGFSRITFQLESDDSVFDSVFHNMFSKTRNSKTINDEQIEIRKTV